MFHFFRKKNQTSPITSFCWNFYSFLQKKLMRQLNAISSRRILDMRKEIAGDEGKTLNLRTMECPDCSAMLDITDFEDTQQMYCHYCDTIVTKRGQRPEGERKMSNCDECNYYAAPVKFTEFYFYFLVVIYGWRYNQRYMCHSCMRAVAWKMFFANLLFILGIPVAIIQLIRSHKGGGPFAGLDRANHHAKKGRLGAAMRAYRELDQQRKNAGVSFNMAMANLAAGKSTEAIAMLEKSLAECSNYAPAYALLSELYKDNNEDAKLKALQKVWGDDEEDAESNPSESLVSDKPVLDIGT